MCEGDQRSIQAKNTPGFFQNEPRVFFRALRFGALFYLSTALALFIIYNLSFPSPFNGVSPIYHLSFIIYIFPLYQQK